MDSKILIFFHFHHQNEFPVEKNISLNKSKSNPHKYIEVYNYRITKNFVIATCTVTEIFLTMLQLHCGDRLQHPAHCGAQLPQPQAEDIPEVPEIIMKNWPLDSIVDPIKMCWILLDPLLTQFSTHKTKKKLKKLLNQYL